MIIVEGPNRCGKTTVGAVLRTCLGSFSYRHTTRPMTDIGPYKYRMWQLADSHPMMIVDRCHWSDYAYMFGKVFRPKPPRGWSMEDAGLSRRQWQNLELAFMSRGATVLVLTDTKENILSRWTDYPIYDCPKEQQLGQLMERYEELTMQCSSPATHLPAMITTLPMTKDPVWMQDFCQMAQRRADRCAPMLPPSLGLGGPEAEFMVIADEMPDGVPEGVLLHSLNGSEPDLPLCRGPLADRFWLQMEAAGVEYWRGYYTTAAAFQNDPERFAVYCDWILPQCKRFICLGMRSYMMVRDGLGDPFMASHQVLRLDDPSTDAMAGLVFQGLQEFRSERRPSRITSQWTVADGN